MAGITSINRIRSSFSGKIISNLISIIVRRDP
jgi:hypothetical protein